MPLGRQSQAARRADTADKRMFSLVTTAASNGLQIWILSVFFPNLLTCFLWLIHDVSVCFYFLSLSIHSHTASHKVGCGVYPASHCSTSPAPLPLSASPGSISLYLDHSPPPTSTFSVSPTASLMVCLFSPTSSLTPYLLL